LKIQARRNIQTILLPGDIDHFARPLPPAFYIAYQINCTSNSR
jgi:hypothetical protein